VTEGRYPSSVRRLFTSLAALAATSLTSAPALAQSWGARLARVLDGIGRTDIIADASGKIPASVTLPPGVSAESLGLASFGDGTASMRLTPAQLVALGEQHPDLDIIVGPPLRPLMDISAQWTNAKKFRETTGYDGKGVVIGVIDTGIDVLHADFRNKDGTTRIKWLLQTGLAPRGKHPDLEKAYCTDQGIECAIFSADDINGFIKTGSSGGTFDPAGHGTHVASIAAGNGGIMSTDNPKYVGVAPAADLIIGSLESFHDADVAATAKFVFDRADEMKQPCVLNLSIGSDYGAHDGSDILDRRLSRLVGDNKPGHAIVAAAGNSGSLYLFSNEDSPWGIHTEAHVYPHADNRVPIWAPKSEDGRGFLWITFQPGDEVSVSLEGPGGTWVGSVAPGHEGGYKRGGNAAGIVNNVFEPESSLQPVTNGAIVVWSGKWSETEFVVHLTGHGHARMWLTSQGDLLKSIGLLFKRGMKEGTINVPASSPSILAVGCTLNRLKWPTVNGPKLPIELDAFGGDEEPLIDSMCFFSSTGPTPTGLPKPEISAPGGFVAGAMAATADPRTVSGGLFDGAGCPAAVPNCYLVDDTHGISAGTSMSSPQVAGAVALLLQANPNLTQAQVTEVIQAGARYPSGKVPNDVQLGAGELDLMGSLRALGPEEAAFASPDPAKSWYVLSDTYARPDPQSPVYGTIELRRTDGEVAHAVSGTFLTLDVTNGIVVSPPTKVRHGLYRFAVAAKTGQGYQEMTVDVRYDGVSLGARTLPIGSGAWAQSYPVDAAGSCSMASSGGSSRSPEWVWAAAIGIALAARRRAAASKLI
jgi:subtilisin family serine protease